MGKTSLSFKIRAMSCQHLGSSGIDISAAVIKTWLNGKRWRTWPRSPQSSLWPLRAPPVAESPDMRQRFFKASAVLITKSPLTAWCQGGEGRKWNVQETITLLGVWAMFSGLMAFLPHYSSNNCMCWTSYKYDMMSINVHSVCRRKRLNISSLIAAVAHTGRILGHSPQFIQTYSRCSYRVLIALMEQLKCLKQLAIREINVGERKESRDLMLEKVCLNSIFHFCKLNWCPKCKWENVPDLFCWHRNNRKASFLTCRT